MRNIIVRQLEEFESYIDELYELRIAAFQQWTDTGLYTSVAHDSKEQFLRYLTDKAVFVAHDKATEELLGMHTLRLNKRKGLATGNNLAISPKAQCMGIASLILEEEVQRLRRSKYRYIEGDTAIPATWSVRWHLKNGYYIVGYNRSEKQNYASYNFRKQIAIDVRHHPTDLFWTRPIGPLTAKILYVASYLAINICKTRSGQLNRIGRMAKRIRLTSFR